METKEEKKVGFPIYHEACELLSYGHDDGVFTLVFRNEVNDEARAPAAIPVRSRVSTLKTPFFWDRIYTRETMANPEPKANTLCTENPQKLMFNPRMMARTAPKEEPDDTPTTKGPAIGF